MAGRACSAACDEQVRALKLSQANRLNAGRTAATEKGCRVTGRPPYVHLQAMHEQRLRLMFGARDVLGCNPLHVAILHGEHTDLSPLSLCEGAGRLLVPILGRLLGTVTCDAAQAVYVELA
jgi:hypothetical protein